MTNPLDPNANMWGLPPNLARKFEPATDIVVLVIWNLNNSTGMSFKTSRPFPVFLRLSRRIVTNITADELNLALGNLMRAGACVIERKSDREMFMFYLEYEDETHIPVNQPHEVDPKQAARWVEELDGLFGIEAMRIPNTGIYEKDNPPVAGNDDGGHVQI